MIALGAYLLVFALFGVAATYFAKFLYFQWRRQEMRPRYIIRALLCLLAIIVLSLLLSLFGY